MLNAMVEIRFLGCLLELTAAPVSRVEAVLCTGRAWGPVSPSWHGAAACRQGGAGTLVPGVQSQSWCVLGVTKLPDGEV